MSACDDCDDQHDEWVVLEFNEDFNYGGVFKTKAEASKFMKAQSNYRNDGLHVVAKCHWAGEDNG